MSPDSTATSPFQRAPWIAAAAVLAGTLCAGGCGRSTSVEPSQPAREIRGAPIQAPAAKAAAVSKPAQPGTVGAGSAAAQAPAPTNAAPASPAVVDGKAVTLSFEQLAGYTFEVTDELLGPVTNDLATAAEKTNSRIPDTVKSFDRKKVALRGFMLPLKVEGGLVTELLIMKDQSMCCYGTAPRINDWVSVKMKNKGVRPAMDVPVTLHGTMRVGEMRENGYLVGIYSMEGEQMDAPEE